MNYHFTNMAYVQFLCRSTLCFVLLLILPHIFVAQKKIFHMFSMAPRMVLCCECRLCNCMYFTVAFLQLFIGYHAEIVPAVSRT
jgi:hypothetical protein